RVRARDPSRLPWPLVASRCERLQRHDFLLAALDQTADMIGPQGESLADLALVTAAIVDPGDAALVATLMVEHGLDNVRLDSDVALPGGNRPPNVMHRPSRYAGTPVERGLAVLPRPRGKAALGTLAEQRVARCHLRHRVEDSAHRRQYRQRMRTAVLGTHRWDCPFAAVNLGPAHVADLATTAAGQDQQSDDAAVVVVLARQPDFSELVVGQHPLAWPVGLRLRRVDHRVGLAQPHAPRPHEETRERAAHLAGDGRTVLVADPQDAGGNVALADAVQRQGVKRSQVRPVQQVPL